ncbi:MAG: hypothetical protein ABIE03_02705 [Patescibacteria group bacterium]|nr:GreA/GreB family elongation factor [Patescibacteria group bacterium]
MNEADGIRVLPVTRAYYEGVIRPGIQSAERAARAGSGAGAVDDSEMVPDGYTAGVAGDHACAKARARNFQKLGADTAEVLERPDQTDVIQVGHCIEVIFDDAAEPVRVHVVTPLDIEILNAMMPVGSAMRARFNNNITAMIASSVGPLGQALVGLRRGESREFTVNVDGPKTKVTVSESEGTIEVSELFDLPLEP